MIFMLISSHSDKRIIDTDTETENDQEEQEPVSSNTRQGKI